MLYLLIVLLLVVFVYFIYLCIKNIDVEDDHRDSSGCVRELLHRSEITSKARYHAARRLAWHGWFSQWTLALLTIGQVVIALASSLPVNKNFSPNYINFASIFFGVVVLAYSLLLGMANFSARSVKLHGCGLELGRLVRELKFLSTLPVVIQSDYDSACGKYYDILDKHENHTKVDYMTAKFDHDFSFIDKDKLCHLRFMINIVRIYFLHVVQFSHYMLSTAGMFLWIYSLLIYQKPLPVVVCA